MVTKIGGINHLKIDRCPHCGVKKPAMVLVEAYQFIDNRHYSLYRCTNCNEGVMTRKQYATSYQESSEKHWPPEDKAIDKNIPEKARVLLEEAHDALSTPNSCLMACASAVDVMLQAKGLREGNLSKRIGEASKQHIITPEMAQWAHQIRLEANDVRHTNDTKDLATPEQAKQVFEFAMALAEFLFVLPARVTRGIKSSSPPPKKKKTK